MMNSSCFNIPSHPPPRNINLKHTLFITLNYSLSTTTEKCTYSSVYKNSIKLLQVVAKLSQVKSIYFYWYMFPAKTKNQLLNSRSIRTLAVSCYNTLIGSHVDLFDK